MDNLLQMIPADQLIHMTVGYSNALLVAVMSNVSEFAHEMELPLPLPVVQSHVRQFRPHPVMNMVGGDLTLTNGDRFSFVHGHVCTFRAYNNFLRLPADIDPDDKPTVRRWSEPLFGPAKMTTTEAIDFSRNALRKLRHDLHRLAVDQPPTNIEEPGATKDGQAIPFCRIEWRNNDPGSIVSIEVDLNRKRLVGLLISSTNAWRPDPILSVKPESQADRRRRLEKPMTVRTNRSTFDPTRN